ncbi:type VI secretion system protein ImpK [Andreprevotia lacus DSM 23236]|uniref:Type VI secretion system protein ImpK n=1 Tax=Andreprevotia lacus DSM 23236 TaxID=1121001 RepID=A0A1W1XLZ2_9NEIS|nr:type VI secretion system protein TssL, long form [Andreprevotia lacus]SMC25010.1 type VI secretion system protein ImpK [Andreprevotia lacus DSM 23236]
MSIATESSHPLDQFLGAAPGASQPAQAYGPADAGAVDALRSGHNAIVSSASPLLYAAMQLRHSDTPQNLAALQSYLVQGIKEFEDAMRRKGVRHEHVVAARYVLCTFLDEVICSCEWGVSWGSCSLLVQFHNETWGGEKFFQLLERLKETPADTRDLLELMYVCLSYGFSGRFGVIDGGQQQLAVLRNQLAELLRQYSPQAASNDLADHWQGVHGKVSKPLTIVPLWVSAILLLVVLVIMYLFLSLRINQHSDPVFGDIQSIRARSAPLAQPKAAAQPRLAQFLEKEIAESKVSVADFADRSVVTILGDGLFESGSADVIPAALPVLHRIGQEVNKIQGKVLVTGHTDNQPIASLRFPSNWHLSQARAQSVRDVLAIDVPANRLTVEGRSDSEPVVKNDTPANRAKNRRVEITVFVTR